jgi:hypothetical protein
MCYRQNTVVHTNPEYCWHEFSQHRCAFAIQCQLLTFFARQYLFSAVIGRRLILQPYGFLMFCQCVTLWIFFVMHLGNISNKL